MCFWCCGGRRHGDEKKQQEQKKQDEKQQGLIASTGATAPTEQDLKDYEDLMHMARKREIKVTIQKGTQAGLAAGLSVMTGVIVAGPVGAVVGGTLGTALAAKISQNVVSLNDLLEQTPRHKRREVLRVFQESFREEFMDTIQSSPELRLLMGGASIFGVMRYMVDRQLLQNEQLVRLDGILRKVA